MTRDRLTSQAFVLVAMALVAVAFSVALYQHGGLPAHLAAGAGVAKYVVLFLAHSFVWPRRRSAASPDLPQATPKARATAAAPAPALNASAGPPAKERRTPAPSAPANPAADLPKQPAAAPARVKTAQMPPDLPFEAFAAPTLTPGVPAAQPAPSTARTPPQPPPAETRMPDDGQSFWDFRPAAAAPAQENLPPFVTGRASVRSQPDPDHLRARSEPTLPAEPQLAMPASPREADVEMIQDAIKRLLEEVNATEREDARTDRATAAPRDPAAVARDEAAIEHSLDALRLTAEVMREVSAQTPSEPAIKPPPLPPLASEPESIASKTAALWAPPAAHAIPPSQARARLLSEAITAGRIDVMLEPILGLEDQKTHHYEVSVRLRDSEGRPLDVYGDGPDLRGTGLLPLFDSISISRVAAVAQRLDERGKRGSIFSTMSGESVADDQFVGELAESLHRRSALATQLVLSFSQADVRHFSMPEWEALADMRALGFRFAIAGITDLDMDFEILAEQGFTFAKLDANVFLSGLPAGTSTVPASDVCRHLAKLGLTLVVEHIADEQQAARIFGFGALLGQGQLFGGARPVRSDAVSTHAA